MELHMLVRLNTLMLRDDGSLRPAFWGTIAFLALMVIAIPAVWP
jgi:hypothetical protein